jgi:putative addiction module component (TIGR02574 family)
MTQRTQSLLKAALALDERERAELAEELLATLAPEVEDEEAELLAELDRRLEEYERDPTSAVPWSELKMES